MLKEFKAFIMKGSVIDLAVAVIIATYFGAIIKSLVNDVIMPPIGKLLGGVDFADIKYVLSEAVMTVEGEVETAEIAIRYGAFINTIITFVIVGFSIFMIIKAYNKSQKPKEEEPEAPPEPSKEEVLLTEIRDALRNK